MMFTPLAQMGINHRDVKHGLRCSNVEKKPSAQDEDM
jgi:hypothetical protein